MKKSMLLALLVTAAGASHANEVSVGATVSPSYRTKLSFQDGATTTNFDSKSSDLPFKLVGGYDFSPSFGIEAGYKDFGKSTIDPVSGSGNFLTTQAKALYVAGRQSLILNDSWSLFGKLGLAYSRTNFDGAGALKPLTATDKKTGLYASAGAAYQLTKNVALTVELEHFDKAKAKGLQFGMDGVAFGVKINF